MYTMKTIKTYQVSTDFSHREIQARNKSDAIKIFKKLMKGLISKNDKIQVY